jgi:acyl dehydratase
VLTIARPSDLLAHIGAEIGPGNWTNVQQARINAFAEATDDRQWIHLDEKRTQAELGHAPVAHGYLTLSLLAPASFDLIQIENVGRMVNYGLNKVRFIAPVLAGDRIRTSMTIARATQEAGFVRAIHDVVVHVERLEKPAMIAQSIILYFDKD